MMPCHRHACAFALVPLFACGAPAANGAVTVGLERYIGVYGGRESLNDTYLNISPSWYRGPFEFGLTLPLVEVSSRSRVIPDGEFEPDIVITREKRLAAASGLGDITAHVRYRVGEEAAAQWSLTTQVKLATGDSNHGLGTGSSDYTVGVEYVRPLRPFLLTLGAGYTWYGPTPDVAAAQVPSMFLGLGHGPVGLGYYAQEPVEPGAPGAREISLYYGGGKIGRRPFNLYLLRGLSTSSPDWGYGFSIGFD